MIADAARRLHEARRAATPIPPLVDDRDGLTLQDAYAIQRAGLELRLAEGAHQVGGKVGLTSQAMQDMLGVDQPDFGYLLDDMVEASGADIEAGSLIAPRVEGEVAFVLAEDLAGPGLTRADVLAATEAVAPALEVIDSRIADWRITIVDTIADNASSGLAVLGDQRPLDGLALETIEMSLTVGDERVTGLGGAVLGHPAEGVAWLGNALAEYGGGHLRAGDIVIPGALGRALPVGPGVTATADFGPLGVVAATFS